MCGAPKSARADLGKGKIERKQSMTELKWLDGVLYFRSLVPTWQASGAWGEPSAWTEWKQVPHEATEAAKNWGNGPKREGVAQ